VIHFLFVLFAHAAVYDVIYKLFRHAGVPVLVGFVLVAVAGWLLTRRRRRW
jgi:LPXTG-motif cell wall-anchored protein